MAMLFEEMVKKNNSAVLMLQIETSKNSLTYFNLFNNPAIIDLNNFIAHPSHNI